MKKTILIIAILGMLLPSIVRAQPDTVQWGYNKYHYSVWYDTLTIGVTLLEATTDSGWAALQEDFGLPVIPKEYERYFCEDSNKVSMKSYPKKNPLYLERDTLFDDLIVVSRYKHTICHFEIKDKGHSDLILYKQYDDNIKSDIKTE